MVLPAAGRCRQVLGLLFSHSLRLQAGVPDSAMRSFSVCCCRGLLAITFFEVEMQGEPVIKREPPQLRLCVHQWLHVFVGIGRSPAKECPETKADQNTDED